MVEIAVFGSLMLYVMAFLVRYGLSYAYQQMTQQEAMRIAMQNAQNQACAGLANCPKQTASVVLLRDRRMVDPTNLFVDGARQTFVGAANVTVDNTGAIFSITKDTELPLQDLDLNDGDHPRQLYLGHFRKMGPISGVAACSLVDVYGFASVQVFLGVDVGYGTPLTYVCPNGRFGDPMNRKDLNDKGKPKCFKVAGQCSPLFNVSILDSCLGDMADPSSCYSQCKQLCEIGLPHVRSAELPYCPSADSWEIGCKPPLAPTVELGLNSKVLHQEHTTNHNERIRQEDHSQHYTETHLDEQDTYDREIRLWPFATPYNTALDPDRNGKSEVKQTIHMRRDESFKTPW